MIKVYQRVDLDIAKACHCQGLSTLGLTWLRPVMSQSLDNAIINKNPCSPNMVILEVSLSRPIKYVHVKACQWKLDHKVIIFS